MPLTLRHIFQCLLAQPLSELDDALLMAGRAEVKTLARKRQQVFMAAIVTSHTGKAEMLAIEVQIAKNHVLDIMPEKSVLPFISVIPDDFQVFEMRFYSSEIMGLERMARLIYIIFDHDQKQPI